MSEQSTGETWVVYDGGDDYRVLASFPDYGQALEYIKEEGKGNLDWSLYKLPRVTPSPVGVSGPESEPSKSTAGRAHCACLGCYKTDTTDLRLCWTHLPQALRGLPALDPFYCGASDAPMT